jgi:hypothetical protein
MKLPLAKPRKRFHERKPLKPEIELTYENIALMLCPLGGTTSPAVGNNVRDGPALFKESRDGLDYVGGCRDL